MVIPERLPIWETEKAVTALTKHGIPVRAVIVNQVLPDPAPDEADSAFLAGRRVREREVLARIVDHLGDFPLLRVRLQETDPVGVDALERILFDRLPA